jgi:hypothetical protein
VCLVPIAGSPHHSIEWQRPAGLKRPQLLNVAIAKLRDPAMQRALFGKTKVYRRSSEDTERHRQARADGMVNFMTLLQAAVASCDVLRGFVGKPVGDTGSWRRFSVEEIGQRAYGKPIAGEISVKRGDRHFRHAVAMGWIKVKEIAAPTPQGPRARVAVKHVSDTLFAVLGLKKMLGAARRERSREKAAGRLQQVTQVLRDALPIKRVRDTRSEEQEEYRIAEENRQKVIAALARMRMHDPPK